jgi:hypothetical protein
VWEAGRDVEAHSDACPTAVLGPSGLPRRMSRAAAGHAWDTRLKLVGHRRMGNLCGVAIESVHAHHQRRSRAHRQRPRVLRQAESHPYELLLAMHGIEHRTTKIRSSSAATRATGSAAVPLPLLSRICSSYPSLPSLTWDVPSQNPDPVDAA